MQNTTSSIESLKSKYKQDFIDYIKKPSFNDSIRDFLIKSINSNKKTYQNYLIYPLLFSQAFDYKETTKIKALCYSGFLLFSSIIVIDRIFDRKSKDISPENLMAILTCNEEAIKILTVLFEDHPEFWVIWEQRKKELLEAINSQNNLKITFSQYVRLADRKSTFGKIAIDALNILSNNRYNHKAQLLITSHKYFSLGMQLIDDSQDIKEDMLQQQYNYAYNKTIAYLKIKDIDYKLFNIDDIKKVFYFEGIADQIYTKAIKAFKKVKEIAIKTGAYYWADVASEMERDAILRMDTIRGYKKIVIKRNELLVTKSSINVNIDMPIADNPIKKSILNGLDYLIEQWGNGLGELKHVMYLSKIDGFRGKQQVHSGDIFQRALLLETFQNAQKKLNLNLESIIDYEIKYLLSTKLKTRVGGWSYFPTVPEIAPDADDLGQMLNVLSCAGKYKEINDLCSKSIGILLSSNTHKNGGIETWIIPKENKTKLQKIQDSFNTNKWGKGPDNEVMANFLYGLGKYNLKNYSKIISKGCTYLITQQTDAGFWHSRWYYGNFYGTYTCLRILKLNNAKNLYSNPILKAITYILSTQNKNGSWGHNEIGDPLNTALAISCLSLFPEFRAGTPNLKTK